MAAAIGQNDSHPLSKCLAGFEHIDRHWAKEFNRPMARILPGEYYVTTQDEIIATVLGSCVSACIRDVVSGVGGMNHFMLPESSGASDGWSNSQVSMEARYGNFAMEQMINAILKNGGKRNNLEVKIFGGGRVLRYVTDIGQKNIEFVKRYIVSEHLMLAAEDVGGVNPRKIYYFPASGLVKVKKLQSMHDESVLVREQAYLDKLGKAQEDSGIDLF